MRLRHADGDRPPRLLHQRAPRRGPRRHHRPARHVRRARSAARSTPTCSGSGCGWPRRSPPGWPPTRRAAAGCGRELDARGLEVVTLNGFPYRRSRPRWSSTPSTTPTGPPASGCAYTLDLARVLADLLPDDAARRLDLHAAAGLAGPVGRRPRRRRRARPRPARRPAWPPCAARPAGRSGSASSRSPAAWWRPPRRPPRCCPAWTPTGSASASTSPTWPAPGRTRPPRSARLRRRRPAGGEGAGVRRAGGRRPGRRGRGAAAATSSRGSCTRPGPAPAVDPADDLDEAARAGGLPGPVAGALPRAAARRPVPPLTSTTAGAARGAARAGRRRRPPRCDHLDVETYTWGVLPAGRSARRRRRAGRRHRRGAGLRPRRAARLGGLGATRWMTQAAGGPRRRRADAAPARAHAPAARASPTSGFRAAAGHRAARGDLLGAVHVPHRRAAQRARHRRQRLVLPRPGRGLLWRQHHALVGGEKVWQAARRHEPGYTVANVCWWYAMGADVDWTVTPAAGLLRRRAQGAGLLHRPAGAARRADRRAGHVPAVHLLGSGRRHRLVAVDLPGGRADPGRPRGPT